MSTPTSPPTLAEHLAEVKRKRKGVKRKLDKERKEGWEQLALDEWKFTMSTPAPEHAFAQPNFSRHCTKLDIFLKIIDQELLLQLIGPTLLHPNKKTLRTPPAKIYAFLAVMCRVQARQVAPNEGQRRRRPLRSSLRDASEHFKQQFPQRPKTLPPGINALETLYTHVLLLPCHERQLSTRFLGCLKQLGHWLAGDEKLFHFTGASGLVRLVPNKPARIGIWHYQLAARLSNGLPFLVSTRTHDSNKRIGTSIPVSEVVGEWAEVIASRQSFHTVLVADSYYLDGAGCTVLLESGVKFVCSVARNRFAVPVGVVERSVLQSGDWAIAWRTPTAEALVHVWDQQPSIGKKFCYTNALKREQKKEKHHVIPAYDAYKFMFGLCDQFNRDLHDRTWPHRHGGGSRHGESGSISDFLFSSVLENVFNIFRCCHSLGDEFVFCDQCSELADELFEHAIALHSAGAV